MGKRKAYIEITSCKECPHLSKRNPYSTDGWDMMEDWYCNLKDKKIQSAVEWFEENKIEIPDWCPITNEKVKTDNMVNTKKSINRGDKVRLTKDLSSLSAYFNKNKIVKVVDIGERGYGFEDDKGNRIIECGWDCCELA